jgi:hypothetical protein
LSGKYCWLLVYSPLLNLWFFGNPIWSGSIPDGWNRMGARWWGVILYGWPPMCIPRLVLFPLFELRITFTFMYENLVCYNVTSWSLYVMLNLYSSHTFVWALRISVILLAWPGKGNRIVLYYCLMATWTGLGDNTELFWAILSYLAPDWWYAPEY